MKKNLFSLFLCLASLGLCAQKYEYIQPFDLKPLKIECSITCEIPDLDLFVISWHVPLIDSIAKAEGQLPSTELHCYVYDTSGLIGYYKGLSAPMQHCDFKTKDSIVEVFFRWRRMPHSYYSQDSTEIRISSLNVNPFNKTPHRSYEFENVRLSVNSTINRKLTVVNDTNTVLISGRDETDSRIGNYDDYGMPILADGLNFYCIISLDKYYLNQKTGRIATGKKWLNRKGSKRISQNADQFLLVSPFIKYIDDDNNQYLGSELIDKRRVKLSRFNIEDLKSHYKDDKRVNDVYRNNGGTIMIDCRN